MLYAGWHNHTDKSNHENRDSIIPVEQLIDIALELGHTGVGITDHGVLSSHVKAIRHLDKLKKDIDKKLEKDPYNILLLQEKEKIENFKLGLGTEIYLVNKEEVDKARENNERTKFYHLVLLAKNKIGHKALRRISTRSWEQSFHHRGLKRTPTYKEDLQEIITEFKGNVVATSACLGSEFAKYVLDYNLFPCEEHEMKIDAYVKYMKELFGEDFYIELQPAPEDNIDQENYNRLAFDIAVHYGVKAIVATDAHYQRPEQRFAHRVFLNSQNAEREVDAFYSSTFIMTVEEIKSMLPYFTDEQINWLLANTQEIAKKIDNYDLANPTQVPRAKTEYDYNYFSELSTVIDTTGYDYINKYLTSEHLIDRILIQQIEKGLERKNISWSKDVLERVNRELGSLWEISKQLKQRLSSYYVLTQFITELMWRTSLVGVSRGSAGAYFIAYAIDITQINPMNVKGTDGMELPDWRHITADRPELPDIDLDTQASERANVLEIIKQEFGHKQVLNICTFKTEGTASAIQTIARGMGISVDDAKYLSSLVVKDGTNVKTVKQCIKEYKTNKECKVFIDELRKVDAVYEGFIDSITTIEGLCNGKSIHASGIYIFNGDYSEINCMMQSNNGQPTTQFDMGDSDYMGGLKIDALTIEGLDRIRKTMDLLLKAGKMEWQGSLKATYDKYLHPDVLEYENPEMWELLYSGEVINAFQFETLVGRSALQKVKPHKLQEVITANSLMRLSVKEGEQPIDKFVRYKNDIKLAYEEMEKAGLNMMEIEIMKKHLETQYFVASTQEDVMRMSMDEKIANFGLKDANYLRKSIAKTKAKDMIQEVKDKFINSGMAQGNRRELLEFVWTSHIEPMLGYAFSEPHVAGYSLILLQELNLVWRYGSLYWKVACLSVNAGDISEDINKGADYGAIAKAIGGMEKGFVLPPYINKAQMEFIPLEKEQKAMYSLTAIVGIGEDVAKEIISNRPYYSFENFYEKMVVTKKVPQAKVYNLIKGGCFDELNRDRIAVMMKFINLNTVDKTSLSVANIPKLLEKNLIPVCYQKEVTLYQFRKLVFNKKNITVFINKSRAGYKIPQELLDFYYSCYSDMFDSAELIDDNGNCCLDNKLFDKIYDNEIIKLKEWLSTQDAIDRFNGSNKAEIWDKYCEGNLPAWEMSSICYYTEEHELDYLPVENYYPIVNFYELDREPVVAYYRTTKSGREIPIHKLEVIAGTVVEKNKNKSTIVLNTKYGIVDVKLSKGRFAHYDRSVEGDKSWLTRGTKLMVVGVRIGDIFYPKTYVDSPYSHTIKKIELNNLNQMVIRDERKYIKEDME